MSEYILLAFGSLFVIIDPLATVPSFLAMTPNDSLEQRLRTAKLACTTAAGILLAFGLTGQLVFRVMGITMPAFQMAASIVLLQVSLDMLRAQRSRVKETNEETRAGVDKTEVAITPLAIPMLAGPGAISTTILLQNQARDIYQRCSLYGCIVGVCFVSYLILRVSARSRRWFGPISMSLAIRIMGLLLASVAVQFMLNAIKAFRLELLSPAG